ncbi:kinesin motor domain-containing protein [Baffinella frigidus]|nr:kinesin motor domain-containing protein [Cryptophyta sp. CCMP2293]
MTEQAGGYHQADVRLKEAMNINLGLLAIKLCIKALNEDTVGYVPYQNSRLTMMLSAALGGECRTAVMVTGSGERKHAVETMHALRFGEDCSRVTTTSREDSMAAARRAIRALDAEIAEVEAAIVAKERWETRRVERVDERHQEDDPLPGTEMVSASALVGAESERDHLEVLLARRKILAGV